MPPSDRRQIIDLTHAYCWALDTGDWDALRGIFLPDATAQLGRTSHRGSEAIIERISSTLARFVGTQHMVNTHEVRVDGDAATCRCYLQAQHVRPEGEEPALLTIGARYEDRLVRTPAGWRITHRDLIEMWRRG